MTRASRFLVALLITLAAAAPARADDVELRIIVPEASVRSGPGERYREVYRAHRGDVLKVLDRSTLAYWFRVELPDGTAGWVLGDEGLPVEVDLGATPGSRAWRKLRETLFAPSPILRSRVGFTFSAGAIGGDGSFLFRPSLVIDDYFALEAHVGEAVGTDASLLLYGLGANVFLWPEGPFIPFFSLGLGGGTSFPKVNAVTQSSSTDWALDAGGGAMVVLRKRFTLRFDVRNYTIFTPNRTANRQEYSGGLAVFF